MVDLSSGLCGSAACQGLPHFFATTVVNFPHWAICIKGVNLTRQCSGKVVFEDESREFKQGALAHEAKGSNVF